MKIKSPNLVFGGISVTIIIILLYIGSLMITNKVVLMSLAIGIGAISYIKGGIRLGVLVYISTSILSMLLVPNKLFVGIYIMFGLYPLIKLFAEKFSGFREYSIKYLAFNFMTILTYFIYSKIIYVGPLFENIYLVIGLFFILQIIFFVFDIAFTKFIMFTEDRVLKRLK